MHVILYLSSQLRGALKVAYKLRYTSPAEVEEGGELTGCGIFYQPESRDTCASQIQLEAESTHSSQGQEFSI